MFCLDAIVPGILILTKLPVRECCLILLVQDEMLNLSALGARDCCPVSCLDAILPGILILRKLLVGECCLIFLVQDDLLNLSTL